VLYKFKLATLGLKLPRDSVHSLSKCNPDAKYDKKMAISFASAFP
jgi:hypothetical protein